MIIFIGVEKKKMTLGGNSTENKPLGCSKEPPTGRETAGGAQGLRKRKAAKFEKEGVILVGGWKTRSCK